MAELGHVVFYVRDLASSLRFYEEGVGLSLRGRIFRGRGALLSGGRTHHELLLIEIGEAEGPPAGRRIGLYHVGWKVGEDLDALRAAAERVSGLGYAIEGLSDHTISQSLYLRDPDGNEVELYVDDPACDWRRDSSWMEAPVRPLVL
jgi:catechol 2,3-dioxygenase